MFGPRTRNSYAQASSSIFSATSHSSGSISSDSRSAEVNGKSLSIKRCRADKTKAGVKTDDQCLTVLSDKKPTLRMVKGENRQDILEQKHAEEKEAFGIRYIRRI